MTQRFLLLFLLPILLVGCNRYQVTFNEQPIHTPPELFTGYRISDSALRDCVAQTIGDLRVTKARELKRLLCSNAGIAALDGLEVFAALETLNLANNALTTVAPLLEMPSLVQVDLSGNSGLDCGPAAALTARGIVTTMPSHCQGEP